MPEKNFNVTNKCLNDQIFSQTIFCESQRPLTIRISYSLTSFFCIAWDHSKEVLKYFIYIFRQTQTAQ